MGIPSIPQTNGPQDDFDNAITQFNAAQRAMQLEKEMMFSLIHEMLALAKSGKIDRAMQMAQNQVMPAVMEQQGVNLKGVAAAMNVSSALQKLTTKVQNDINDIAAKYKTDPAEAKKMAEDLVKTLQQYYHDIQSIDTTTGPMSADTKSNLIQAFSKISNILGGATPDDLNAPDVGARIASWTASPTSTVWNMPGTDKTPPAQVTNPDGKTGQECLRDLNAGISQLNNTVSAQSQGLQAQVQFESHTLTQYMNTLSAIFQAASKQCLSMIGNQKS